MNRFQIALVVAGVCGLTEFGPADAFNWVVDSDSSVLTTTISTTLGATLSDTETNRVSGFIGGDLLLPAFTFGSIHVTTADLSYTTNPSFSLTSGFLGGVNIVGNGLGFAIPGSNNLGFVSPTPANVALNGAFSQAGNGAEGRGTLTYTGVGLLGSSIGSGTIDLVDQSPLPMDFNGTLTQAGSVLRLTVPISVDQTTTQNNIPVRVQISGNVIADATTTANGWKADVDGNWNTSANWVDSTFVPGVAGQTTLDTAVFGDFGSNSVRTIGLQTIVHPRRVIIAAGPTGKYNLVGSGAVMLTPNANGAASISVVSGAGEISSLILPAVSSAHVEVGASLTLSTVTSPPTNTFSKSGGGNLQVRLGNLNQVNVTGGVLAFVHSTSGAVVDSLQIGPAGTVAITDTLVIESQTGGVAQVMAYLRNSLASGLPGGIVQPATGQLGLVTQASTGLTTFNGVTLTDSSVILFKTIAGDTNFDRDVDFDDLLAVAQNYGGSGLWSQGDFNYDTLVGFDDLLALAQQYGAALSAGQLEQLPSMFVREFALAQSIVPEPMMFALLPLALSSRRRRD